MKKINIFLASSIVEFKSERMVLENFIRNLSDKFEESYNVKLQPLLCENFDDAYTVARKQEEYNEKIRESELCFFIFFTKVGEYTREEFDVARDQFEKNGSPKIYTYFKAIEEGSGEESLYSFMNELDKVFGHYYGTFSHIDTVKLRILLSLKLREMDFLEIKADGGKCIVDGKSVMSLDNVTEFANNKELQKLTKELEETEAEYYKLKPLYEKNNNDPDFYKKYSAVASRRQYLIDETEELQKLIFNISLRMTNDDTHGTITERQRSAYKLFEQGDYEGCMSVLDSVDIDSDFLRDRKRLREQELAVCRKYIREHKTAIDILLSMKSYGDRFAEAEERYEKIIPVILEMNMSTEIDTAKDYISYLIDQNKESKALPVAQKLVGLCEKDSDAAVVLNSLGLICVNLNKAPEAEEYYLKAIEIIEKLVRENPEMYSGDLADSYNNAGSFYAFQGQPAKAEEYYIKSIEINEKLVQENPEMYSGDLAGSYNNAGVFYYNQEQPEKAEEYLLKSIEINEKLVQENPEMYSGDLAGSYSNAGYFYNEHGQPKKAEEYLLKAIEIRGKLAQEDPEMYSGDLATSYNNAGNFYDDQEQPEKAEEYYLKSIEIREKLAHENLERYSGDLATSYNNTGCFYDNQGQPEKAEEYYLKAIEIREKLARENPERYSGDLAQSYNNAGSFYDDQGQPKKAEEYFLKSIEIREKLARENPARYSGDLAGSYNNAGSFYNKHGQPEKAEEYYLKSIEIREKLAWENPEMYSGDLAGSYDNAGYFYNNQGQPEKAEKYYLKAIEIIEKLARENPERYIGNLAQSYNNAGNFYANQGQPEKAEEYYLKSIEIKEKLVRVNPGRYIGDLAGSYNNAGNFYADQGQPEKAEEYYLKSIEIREKLVRVNPGRYIGYLAASYFNYGIFKKNDDMLKKALELAKKMPNHPMCKKIIERSNTFQTSESVQTGQKSVQAEPKRKKASFFHELIKKIFK